MKGTKKDSNTILRRNTKQKALVLETVQEHRDHPTADMIYVDVRKKNNKVSKGTVYRNLNELSRLDKVNQLKVPGADRFDLRVDNHYHILCTKCGIVEDVNIDYSDALNREAEKVSGYIVTKHRTLFEGICPKCQQNKRMK